MEPEIIKDCIDGKIENIVCSYVVRNIALLDVGHSHAVELQTDDWKEAVKRCNKYPNTSMVFFKEDPLTEGNWKRIY